MRKTGIVREVYNNGSSTALLIELSDGSRTLKLATEVSPLNPGLKMRRKTGIVREVYHNESGTALLIETSDGARVLKLATEVSPLNPHELDNHDKSENDTLDSAKLLREDVDFRDQFSEDRSSQKSRLQPKRCTKGFSCKGTCISKDKVCAQPLAGEFVTYATWLAHVIRQNQELSNEHLKAAQKLGFIPLTPQGLVLNTRFNNPAPFKLKESSLNEISSLALDPTEQKSLAVVKAYENINRQMNSALNSIKSQPNLSHEDYKWHYEKIDALADDLRKVTIEAQSLSGRVKNEMLAQHLSAISSVSREALPGYEVRVPSALEEVSKKIEIRPC